MNKELKQTLALILDNQRLIMSYVKPNTFNCSDLKEAVKQTKLAVIELTKEESNTNLDNNDLNKIFIHWNKAKD